MDKASSCLSISRSAPPSLKAHKLKYFEAEIHPKPAQCYSQNMLSNGFKVSLISQKNMFRGWLAWLTCSVWDTRETDRLFGRSTLVSWGHEQRVFTRDIDIVSEITGSMTGCLQSGGKKSSKIYFCNLLAQIIWHCLLKHQYFKCGPVAVFTAGCWEIQSLTLWHFNSVLAMKNVWAGD